MTWKETILFMLGTFLITAGILYMGRPKEGPDSEILKFEMRQMEPLNPPKGI